jgi:hypothetical protein
VCPMEPLGRLEAAEHVEIGCRLFADLDKGRRVSRTEGAARYLSSAEYDPTYKMVLFHSDIGAKLALPVGHLGR